jgi:5-methylcytosine-specific restriction endonuclease McrA
MTEPLAPPYAADTRAKGWRFELDLERIRQSDTWALAAPELRPWLLMLWAVAWEQTPCGSMPAEPGLIAARIGMAPKAFERHKALLLRGWKESGGRLYHPVITERVLEMTAAREKTATRKSLYDKRFYAIRARDGGTCVYCGDEKYLSLDHLIAVSRGGSGEDSNLVTACRHCNSKKGARTPDEARMTFLNKAAEALWNAIRTERVAEVTRYGQNVTPQERGDDATGTGTGTGTIEEKEKSTRKRALPPQKPEGVGDQTWTDWLALRAKKRAPVTQTVLDGAAAEAVKAAMTLDAFLRIWCMRGSQGFEAGWIRADERRGVGVQSFRAQDVAAKAARYDEMSGGLVGAKQTATVIEMEVPDAPRLARR